MKQILFTTALIIFGLSNVTAQTKGDIELGAGAGISTTSIIAQDDRSGISVNTANRITYNIQLSGEYYFSEKWGIKINAIYDNKGYQISVDNQENPSIAAFTYITIPLRANWHFGRGDQKKWYLNFGAYAGFLTDVRFSTDGVDNPGAATIDDFNKLDFGLDFGIGYKHRLGERIKLYAELAVQAGIANALNGSGNVSSLFPSVQFNNSRVSINVGILYDL